MESMLNGKIASKDVQLSDEKKNFDGKLKIRDPRIRSKVY